MTTVLVAEDDEDILLLVATRLKRDGFDVLTARTGEEALELVRERRPEVAVLDISLPVVNGIEATRQILKEASGTEVMIFTSRATESDIREVLRAGARSYILRSETDERIVRAVEALARHHAFFSDHVSEALLNNFVKQAAFTPAIRNMNRC